MDCGGRTIACPWPISALVGFGELALPSDAASAAQHGVQSRDLLDLVAHDDAFEDFAVASQITRDLNHVRSPRTSCMS